MNNESFVKVSDLHVQLHYYTPIYVKEYNDDINKQLDEVVENGIKECNQFINDYNLEQDKKYNEKSFIYKWFNKKTKLKYSDKRMKELIMNGIDLGFIGYHYYDYFNEFSKIICNFNDKYNKLQCLKINEPQLKKILNLTKYGTDIYLSTSDAMFIEDCKNKISFFLNKKK
jgi:hypothetical protein